MRQVEAEARDIKAPRYTIELIKYLTGSDTVLHLPDDLEDSNLSGLSIGQRIEDIPQSLLEKLGLYFAGFARSPEFCRKISHLFGVSEILVADFVSELEAGNIVVIRHKPRASADGNGKSIAILHQPHDVEKLVVEGERVVGFYPDPEKNGGRSEVVIFSSEDTVEMFPSPRGGTHFARGIELNHYFPDTNIVCFMTNYDAKTGEVDVGFYDPSQDSERNQNSYIAICTLGSDSISVCSDYRFIADKKLLQAVAPAYIGGASTHVTQLHQESKLYRALMQVREAFIADEKEDPFVTETIEERGSFSCQLVKIQADGNIILDFSFVTNAGDIRDLGISDKNKCFYPKTISVTVRVGGKTKNELLLDRSNWRPGIVDRMGKQHVLEKDYADIAEQFVGENGRALFKYFTAAYELYPHNGFHAIDGRFVVNTDRKDRKIVVTATDYNSAEGGELWERRANIIGIESQLPEGKGIFDDHHRRFARNAGLIHWNARRGVLTDGPSLESGMVSDQNRVEEIRDAVLEKASRTRIELFRYFPLDMSIMIMKIFEDLDKNPGYEQLGNYYWNRYRKSARLVKGSKNLYSIAGFPFGSVMLADFGDFKFAILVNENEEIITIPSLMDGQKLQGWILELCGNDVLKYGVIGNPWDHKRQKSGAITAKQAVSPENTLYQLDDIPDFELDKKIKRILGFLWLFVPKVTTQPGVAIRAQFLDSLGHRHTFERTNGGDNQRLFYVSDETNEKTELTNANAYSLPQIEAILKTWALLRGGFYKEIPKFSEAKFQMLQRFYSPKVPVKFSVVAADGKIIATTTCKSPKFRSPELNVASLQEALAKSAKAIAN